MAKRGRPRKPGERYECGKLKKPGGESVSPAQWQRICNDAVILTKDTRLASAIGRLSFHRELTARQSAAAFRIGQVYGAFEALHGASRQIRSPGYEIGHRGGSSKVYDPEKMSAIEAAFFDLQDQIPHSIRGPLEVLCVDNCAVSSLRLDDIRWTLERLASHFKLGPAKEKAKRASAPAPKPQDVSRPGREIFDRPFSAFNMPDLETEDMGAVISFARALKDRAEYRQGPSVRGVKSFSENSAAAQ